MVESLQLNCYKRKDVKVTNTKKKIFLLFRHNYTTHFRSHTRYNMAKKLPKKQYKKALYLWYIDYLKSCNVYILEAI